MRNRQFFASLLVVLSLAGSITLLAPAAEATTKITQTCTPMTFVRHGTKVVWRTVTVVEKIHGKKVTVRERKRVRVITSNVVHTMSCVNEPRAVSAISTVNPVVAMQAPTTTVIPVSSAPAPSAFILPAAYSSGGGGVSYQPPPSITQTVTTMPIAQTVAGDPWTVQINQDAVAYQTPNGVFIKPPTFTVSDSVTNAPISGSLILLDSNPVLVKLNVDSGSIDGSVLPVSIGTAISQAAGYWLTTASNPFVLTISTLSNVLITDTVATPSVDAYGQAYDTYYTHLVTVQTMVQSLSY